MIGKETKLYRDAAKSKRLFLISALICLLLLTIFLYSLGLYDGILRIKGLVISRAILLIMLYLLINSLRLWNDKNPLIILDENSFTGKTTPLSKAFGTGLWEDVKDIELVKVGGDTLVTVTLNNTSKYKDRLSKLLWKMAYDEQSDTLQIMYSASEITVDERQLFELFTSHWRQRN